MFVKICLHSLFSKGIGSLCWKHPNKGQQTSPLTRCRCRAYRERCGDYPSWYGKQFWPRRTQGHCKWLQGCFPSGCSRSTEESCQKGGPFSTNRCISRYISFNDCLFKNFFWLALYLVQRWYFLFFFFSRTGSNSMSARGRKGTSNSLQPWSLCAALQRRWQLWRCSVFREHKGMLVCQQPWSGTTWYAVTGLRHLSWNG